MLAARSARSGAYGKDDTADRRCFRRYRHSPRCQFLRGGPEIRDRPDPAGAGSNRRPPIAGRSIARPERHNPKLEDQIEPDRESGLVSRTEGHIFFQNTTRAISVAKPTWENHRGDTETKLKAASVFLTLRQAADAIPDLQPQRPVYEPI